MDHKIEIDGSIQKLIESAYKNAGSFMRNSKLRKFMPKQSHTENQSEDDVQRHYNIGNDFYRLWLDDTLTYSCAYFTGGNQTDLTASQMAKVHQYLKEAEPTAWQDLVRYWLWLGHTYADGSQGVPSESHWGYLE